MFIVKNMEIEIDDPAVAELDTFWRNTGAPVYDSPELHAMVDKAALAVEQAADIPFGDDSTPETISSVYAMDGEAILEW